MCVIHGACRLVPGDGAESVVVFACFSSGVAGVGLELWAWLDGGQRGLEEAVVAGDGCRGSSQAACADGHGGGLGWRWRGAGRWLAPAG